jgi:capsular exopolysaccharide synthesis family protein
MTQEKNTSAEEKPACHGDEPGPFQQVWRVCRRRKGRILVAVVLGLGLAALYAAKAGPWYDSTAQLLVVKKRHETSPISGPDQAHPPEDYLATHMLLITSDRVIRQAIQRGKLEDLEQARQEDVGRQIAQWTAQHVLGRMPPGPSESTLAKAITGALRVSRDAQRPGLSPSNEILILSYRGKAAADCPRVLDAVIASYQAFLMETYRKSHKETVELVTQARDLAHKDLQEKEAAYQRFLKGAPLLGKGKGGSTIVHDRLAGIEARRSALRLRTVEIEAALTVIANAVQAGRNPLAILELVSGPSPDHGAATPPAGQDPWLAARGTGRLLVDELLALQILERKLAALKGDNHPDVQAVRRQLEAVRAMLSPTPVAPGQPGAGPAYGQDLLRMKTDLLTQERDDLKVADQALARLIDQEQKAASGAAIQEIQEETHREEINRARLLYESILRRLEETRSIKDFGGYDVQVLSAPLAGELALKKYFLIVGLGLFAGLLVGFGSACLAEVADRSFRSPRQVHDALGLPVIGQIPLRAPAWQGLLGARTDNAKLYPLLPSYHQASSTAAEAYRAVRTVLYAHSGAAPCRVILVTSPCPRDGKTTLVTNLAVCIAQSGKRLLLMDGDLRRPHLHEIYRLPAKTGLASVLMGETDLATAIQPGPVPGLSVLPAGPAPTNPADLLTSPRLGEILESLRQRYDFVLIDAPPLLHVTDPAVVAPKADQVLLAVRLGRTERAQAERAREVLEALGANVLGVVVHGGTGRRGALAYD